MNNDIFGGKWKQFKGEVQKQWGKLTNSQIDKIQGDREKLIGAIQENYGVVREVAEKQIDKWEKSIKDAA
ncbi:MAG: CsbD family protein [Alphaproteobacteria bacterium]|nr:CsbD family protein [Alphaproteobacteria bacterium]